MDGAEVLTTAYFDENGELVCEDAVDSDDDLFNGGCDEDPDAQATALIELNDTHQASSMLLRRITDSQLISSQRIY